MPTARKNVVKTAILILLIGPALSCVSTDPIFMQVKEIQLTSDGYGHTLNSIQCFSPDDHWIAYDIRNDDTAIASTSRIEMVNTATGQKKVLYQTARQSEFGPGVGAAAFSPVQNQVIFIHGLRNASKDKPYSFTRRTGVAISVEDSGKARFMDARNINYPFTPGALRGGTHAYAWNSDGRYLCFTYNDWVMERLNRKNNHAKDLRTVGVMLTGHPVRVKPDATLENHSGEAFSVLVAKVTDDPKPGSNEIDKAFDEGWIGTNGYIKPDGSRQKRAIAFQGNVRDKNGLVKTEVFIADLPDDLTQTGQLDLLQGTATERPGVPAGTVQRRVTFTSKGMEGPRHWLRTTPDGELIGFLMRDQAGFINIFCVSPRGGDIRQITFNSFNMQTGFNFSPDGRYVAYIADNSVFVNELATGRLQRLTSKNPDENKPCGYVTWSNSGNMLAYNRYINQGKGRFLQIFILQLTGK